MLEGQMSLGNREGKMSDWSIFESFRSYSYQMGRVEQGRLQAGLGGSQAMVTGVPQGCQRHRADARGPGPQNWNLQSPSMSLSHLSAPLPPGSF